MARTNSFTIKASLTTLLFLISLIFFYISYLDFMKIKDEETRLRNIIDNQPPSFVTPLEKLNFYVG